MDQEEQQRLNNQHPKAAEMGGKDAGEKALDAVAGVEVNNRDDYGCTPLHWSEKQLSWAERDRLMRIWEVIAAIVIGILNGAVYLLSASFRFFY